MLNKSNDELKKHIEKGIAVSTKEYEANKTEFEKIAEKYGHKRSDYLPAFDKLTK